jgi:predicted DNA-binding transcriptional regulator YafY
MQKKKKPNDTEAIRRGMLVLEMLRPDSSLTIKQIHQNLLNEGISISVRTIERDLVRLERAFPNRVKVIGSKPYGYRRPADAPKNSSMSAAEALCLELAHDYLLPLLPNKTLDPINPYLKEAKEVLDETSSYQVKNWKSKVLARHEGINLKPAKIKAKILEKVQEALFSGKQVKAKYLAKNNSNNKTYVLNPGGLVHRGRISYLICSFDNYPKDISYLALHRFQDIKILDPDSKLKNKNVKNLVKGVLGFTVGDKIKIKLKFSKFAGFHLYETPLSSNQKIYNSKGYTILEAQVDNDMDLRFWIRGFGDNVEVLTPLSLRKEFQKLANNISEMYGKN